MSQTNTPCPICERPPGGVHDKSCPRSSLRRKLLDVAMRDLGAPRLAYMSKGSYQVTVPGALPFLPDKVKVIENPGIPWVKPPRAWYAGGFPNGMNPKDVEEFLNSLGLEVPS